MLTSLASIVLGVGFALTYQHFALRSQARFAREPGAAGGLMFAGGLMVRFAALGMALVGVQRWTPLQVVVVAVTFVACFTVLHGYALYRYALGRGPFDEPTRSADGGASRARRSEGSDGGDEPTGHRGCLPGQTC